MPSQEVEHPSGSSVFKPCGNREQRLPQFEVSTAHLGHHILPPGQVEPLAAMLDREDVQSISQRLPPLSIRLDP
jgi:hypothetical protein